MVLSTLLGKELREHGPALFLQALAFLTAMWFALLQQRGNIAGLSSFQVLGFALMSFLPLMAILTAERLLTREYLSGTRRFLDSLPMSAMTVLVLKYLFGLSFVTLLGALALLIARLNAGLLDLLPANELMVMASQVFALLLLFWSIAFCFSLTGHLRFLLYVALIGGLYLLLSLPGVDPWKFGPAALLEPGKLALERQHFPIGALLQTIVLAALFTLAGFLLARYREGNASDRMARAMNPRDFALLAGLLMLFSTLFGLLHEEADEAAPFSGGELAYISLDNIEVFYHPQSEPQAKTLAKTIENDIEDVQEALSIRLDTPVQLIDDNGLDWPKFNIDESPHLMVSIDLGAADSASRQRVIRAVVLHELINTHADNRLVFEPYHWLLDGWIRWWIEPDTSTGPDAEMLARALIALEVADQFGIEADLSQRWQQLADIVSYPSAEALAYSALVWLESRQGKDTIMNLGREMIARRVPVPMKETLRYLHNPAQQQFETISGLSWSEFLTQWRLWLEQKSELASVRHFLDRVIPEQVSLQITGSESTGLELEAHWQIRADAIDVESNPGQCQLHQVAIPVFDSEMGDRFDVNDELDCSEGSSRIPMQFGHGQRIYAVFEFSHPAFAQPVRLASTRLAVSP